MTTNPAIRALRLVRAGGCLALFLLMALPWCWLSGKVRLSRPLVACMWRILLRGFGIEIRCHGLIAPPAGTLYVANHISWSDIAVLAGVVDAGFVAKSEVGEWPVVGALSRRYGCLFIERGRRGKAQEQASSMGQHMNGGSALILFPEGTTGEGSKVLPFRSSLFAVAERGQVRQVQPVTLVYRRKDGSAMSPEERRRAAWMDDDALLPHAAALAMSGGLLVDVHFEHTVSPANRKAMAEACHAAISARIAETAAADCHRTDPKPSRARNEAALDAGSRTPRDRQDAPDCARPVRHPAGGWQDQPPAS